MIGRKRKRAMAPQAMPDYITGEQPAQARPRRGVFGKRPNLSNGLMIAGASLQDAFGDTRGNVQSTLAQIDGRENAAWERQQYEQEMMREQQQAAQARQAQEQQQAQEASALGALNLSPEDLARYNLGEGLPGAQEQYGVISPEEVEQLGLPAGSYQRNATTGEIESIRGQSSGIYGAKNVQSTFVDDQGVLQIVRRNGQVESTNQRVRNPLQITDVGGVPTAINRQTGVGRAVSTPEQVGGNKATINTIESQEASRVEAREDLPRALQQAANNISVIDNLLANDGFEKRYGLSSGGGRLPSIPGSQSAEAQAFIDQIGGAAFLQAFQSLKGGGQITEIEGAKATAAITRLADQNISPDAARRAAEELKAILTRAASQASVRAGGNQQQIDDEIATLERELGLQ